MGYSIHELFTNTAGIKNWPDFWLKLGNFLDDFKRNPLQERLESEPDFTDPLMAPFLAACVESLAYDYDLPIPQWVFHKKYYLKEPYFAGGFKGEYNIFLLRESPLEFKARNIFVSNNVLSRC